MRLRALAMAQDDKRTREVELAAFLQDTQPSMSHITVAELTHIPAALMVTMGAFVTYKKSSKQLQLLEERARAEERAIAAQLENRRRKAEYARLLAEENAKEKRDAELKEKARKEREELVRKQEERRKREAEEERERQEEARKQREAQRKREEQEAKQKQEEEELFKRREQEDERLKEEQLKRKAALEHDRADREARELRQLLASQQNLEQDGNEERECVVTTYGVEVGTSLKEALANIEKGVNSGELSGKVLNGGEGWVHQFPNRFVDPDFGISSLKETLGPSFEAARLRSSNGGGGGNDDELGHITMRRGDTIIPGLTNKLVPQSVLIKGKKPTPDNLHQGAIGDCWLIAGIATVCEMNDGALIKAVFLHADHDKGIYALRMFLNGLPRIVFIDDYLPVRVNDPLNVGNELSINNRQVMFCGLDRPEYFWCCLIEKAYAKLTGSYDHIVGGYEDAAMADLTGGIPSKVLNLHENQNEIWANLLASRRNGDLLGAGSLSGSDTDKNDQGVVLGHAYSILDVRELEGNRLLQMRNPWGTGEWSGRWSDRSTEWTPRYKTA